MKFGYVAGLLGAATAISVDRPETDEALVQEAQQLEQECKDYDQIDESSLLETEEDADRYTKNIKSSHRAHYGKSKYTINRENRKILSTQAKCLKFVRDHRGHEKVCNWCRARKPPADRWKWVGHESVWYRWYDGKWHYWGPSKTGFTTKLGWTWYKGYWHHRGYVYKYVHKRWYRFQGGKWVYYTTKIPINPGIPRGKRICRPFYILKKYGFPASLRTKRLPRCAVGQGRRATYYMWKGHAACRFLGGRLQYVHSKICKSGRKHSWARVVRCVRGPVITHKGFNYKTGRGRHVRRVRRVRRVYRKTVVRSSKQVMMGSAFCYERGKKDNDCCGHYYHASCSGGNVFGQGKKCYKHGQVKIQCINPFYVKKTKCYRNRRHDKNCCSKPNQASCARGYTYAKGGKCGKNLVKTICLPNKVINNGACREWKNQRRDGDCCAYPNMGGCDKGYTQLTGKDCCGPRCWKTICVKNKV